ncbi:MAG: sensor histidine kinase [Bacillota bacterium]
MGKALGLLFFLLIAAGCSGYEAAPDAQHVRITVGAEPTPGCREVFEWDSALILACGLAALLLVQSVLLVRQTARAIRDTQRSRRLLNDREEFLRREIAERLHSRVQSRLLTTELALGELERWDGPDRSRVRAIARRVRQEIRLVREEEVRRLSHLLHPSIIQVGLIPAVRCLAEHFRPHFEVDIVVDSELAALDGSLEESIPESCRLAAYRVLEEALANVCAHARAKRVEIALGLTRDGQVQLEVQDDGKGLQAARNDPGLGLRVIAARVEEQGGRWTLAGRPGGGAVLRAWFPTSSPQATTARSPADR